MARRPAITALVVTMMLVVTPLPAQVVGTLGAGTGHVTYDDSPRATIVSLTPAVMFEGERTTLSAVGSFTRFDGGIWSAQGVIAGSRFTDARGLLRGELFGQAETNSHRGTLRTSQLLAQGRAHLANGERGLWAGAGAGHAWRSPAGGSIFRGDVGAWAQLGDATLRVTAAHNVVGTSERTFEASPLLTGDVQAGRNTVTIRSTVRYLDMDAHVSWMSARLALEASAGQRRVRNDENITTWLVGGSVMLTERLSLVGATGSNAYDFAQALPGGRYASIALRVTTRPGGGFDMRARRRAVAEGLQTSRELNGLVVVMVTAPRAHRVEIMGDFTDWRPLALRRDADGNFSTRVHLPPGSYRLNVRVDGGQWTTPPGTTPVADEYNGAAGLLIVGT